MKKRMILAAAILACAATPAMANEGMGRHHGIHAMLKRADTNHDGKVTKAEFIAAVTQHAEKRFAHMDANHDGVLDDKDHQAHFDQMDSNHDGSISRDEFKQFHREMKTKKHKRGQNHE
ncbi:MAG: EF-hand domain-containing protein [Mariprofundales bacterium]|nr:EF-hand domain-containing protein [Mariprofundales bacterium]